MKFVEICYPIKHAQGSFLWDAGVADAIAILLDSQRRRNLRMIRWPRPKTLASQSEQVGVKPTDGVTIVATPGHTPGHRSLLVRFPKTGAILLSGDAVHFNDNSSNRRLPETTRTTARLPCNA